MKRQSVPEKLAEFKTFGNKWGYENSIAFDDYVLEKAEQLNIELLSYHCDDTNVFPGSAGEILLVGYYETIAFDICINPDRTFQFYFEIPERKHRDEFVNETLESFLNYIKSMIITQKIVEKGYL